MDTIPHVSIRLVDNAERVRRGWPLDSPYVEEFWLPVIGPSSLALLRWCARHADRLARYHTMAVSELAQQLGLGHANAGGHRYSAPCNAWCCSTRTSDTPTADAASIAVTVHSHLFTLQQRQVTKLPRRCSASTAGCFGA